MAASDRASTSRPDLGTFRAAGRLFCHEIGGSGTGRPSADDEFARFVEGANVGLVRLGAFLVGERAGGEDVAQTPLLEVGAGRCREELAAASPLDDRPNDISVTSVGRRLFAFGWPGIQTVLGTTASATPGCGRRRPH